MKLLGNIFASIFIGGLFTCIIASAITQQWFKLFGLLSGVFLLKIFFNNKQKEEK